MRKVLSYAAIYLLWGGSFVATREIVAVTPPFFAAALRFLVAGLLLILYAHLRKGALPDRQQFLSTCMLGFLMFTCPYAGLFWAQVRVPSGIAGVIQAMIPLWIFVGEVSLLRTQRATFLSTAGVLVGFAGVTMLALSTSRGDSQASTVAVLVLIGGTLCWSAGTLWSRRLSLPKLQTASAGWQMGFGGLFLLLISAATGESPQMAAAFEAWSPRVVLSMTYLVIAASIVAFTAYVWLIAHEPAARVASYAYVTPVVALLLGVALAGERLRAPQVAGAALVIAGVFATLKGKAGGVVVRGRAQT